MVIDLTLPGAVAPFRVLVVSDRSTCRGPAAQRLLAAHLRAGGWDGDVVVGAAGVGARAGDALHPDTARALTELDVDAGGHVARRLTERRVVQADLLLAVARRQVRHVAAARPDAVSRTFGLQEFTRLAALLGPDEGAERHAGEAATGADRVASLDALRTAPGAPDRDLDLDLGDRDLDDPAGGGYADHRRMVRVLDGLTLQVAQVLTAWVPGEPAPGAAPPGADEPAAEPSTA